MKISDHFLSVFLFNFVSFSNLLKYFIKLRFKYLGPEGTCFPSINNIVILFAVITNQEYSILTINHI